MKIDTSWHLINQINTAVLILNETGIIRLANQEFLRLLGCETEGKIQGSDLNLYLSEWGREEFSKSFQSLSFDKNTRFVDTLTRLDGTGVKISLSGKKLQDPSGSDPGSIWTIKEILPAENTNESSDQEKKLEDFQWLADQGQELLSINHWRDILDIAGQALQKKLGDCIVVTLTKVDEKTLKLEEFYGIENQLLSQVLNLIGVDKTDKLFPIDERYKHTYNKRQLYRQPVALEDFASSYVPRKISRQLESMIGLEDIYTIGLEGNGGLLGCFYIFSVGADLLQHIDLVESFTFQVAMALERTRYAEDLKLSEQQFQTIFEYAPDGYYLSDLQGNFLNGNLSAEAITGYKRKELIGKNLLTAGLISKEHTPRAGKLLAQNLLGSSTGPDEFLITRKDGSEVQVEITTHPVKLGEKAVVLGIARDISNRKQAERTLAKTHDSLTRVLEGIDAHVYVADFDNYEILYMNRKMIEDFGGNFTGHLCYKTIRKEKEPCSFCTNSSLVSENGKPVDVVVWEDENNKTGHWYCNYDRAIYWTDQRLARIQIAVDITDSKTASSALMASEERYRYLFESSHDAVMTLGPPEWSFTSGNPALVDMFALESEEAFLSHKPWDLSPQLQPDGRKSKEKAREMIEIAVDQGAHYFRWTHKKVNGEEFPATVQLTRVDHDDNYFLQATVKDITDQLKSEERINQQMDDLALINKLNIAANEGQNIDEIFYLFSVESGRVFHANNSSIFLVDDLGENLTIDPRTMNEGIREHLGNSIKLEPAEKIVLPLDKIDAFKNALQTGEIQILSSSDEMLKVHNEVVAASPGLKVITSIHRKIAPDSYERSRVQSIVVLPLRTAGNNFGLVLIRSRHRYTEKDKERFASISGQLSGLFHRVQADQERIDNIHELELIYRTFVEGSRIDDIDELCQHLAEKISDVNPGSYVMVTLYDWKVDAIRVRALTGLGEKIDHLFQLIGKKPEDFRIGLDDMKDSPVLNEMFVSGKMELIPGGLYDLVRGKIPRPVCKSVERLMGVDKAYFTGFGFGKTSVGGLIIFTKEGKEVNYPEAIESIVNHFAGIFERRHAQGEILRKKAQLEALRDVELDIVSQLNLEELLFSIAGKAVSIVNAVASGFSVYNEDLQRLEFIAFAGYEALPDDPSVKIGEGLAGRVWQSHETLIVENYYEWEGLSEDWAPFGNYYLAGIPVCWGDEILGVLEVALNISEELSATDIDILELFATQAAIAIKNARLFSEEQMRRQEAETLREGGMLINQMVGRPELLDMILTALQKVVPYSNSCIQLVQGSDIIIEALRGSDQTEKLIGKSSIITGSELLHQILFEGKNMVLNSRKEILDLGVDHLGERVQSWLGVPLEIKGNRIGLISLNHELPLQFSSRDAELVHDFANQAVIAIENNRLFDELRRRTREIEVVYESALVLTQELQPEIFFGHLHEQVEKLFKPDTYLLTTFDQNTEYIQIEYATESGVRQLESEGMKLSLGEENSLLSWIVRNKTPLLIGNVETDSLPVRPQQSNMDIRSFLGVPLLISDRVIGALIVQAYEPQAYNQEHRRLLQLMGNQVAIALENSRLFEDARRRLFRLSSLREIDQAISGSLNLEKTMDVLINQLTSTLNVDAACVLAYDVDQRSLEYASGIGFWTNTLQGTSLPVGKGLAGKAAQSHTPVYIPDLTAEITSLHNSPHFDREKFVVYFAHPLLVEGELVGVLEIFHRNHFEPDTEWISFLDALVKLAAIAIDRINLYNNLEKSNIELKDAYDATIEGWARAIELRDDETEGHSRRVASIVLNLARKMGVEGDALTHIRRGALLHDIGKMAIPDGILLNTGKLTSEEWVIMKKHPVFAYEMLSAIDYLLPALDIPYYHHERWDGSGYPRGLSGENIPFAARIFAVVDVWDALQSDRPYRKAWSEKKIIQYLKDQAGKEFDPRVVAEFMELIGKR